jgi:hypothetical protein
MILKNTEYYAIEFELEKYYSSNHGLQDIKN